MKVQSINNKFYYNIATNVQNKNISSPSFCALSWSGKEKTGNQVNWRGAEDSNKPLSFTQQMLNYGFEALDENTLFITTTNEAKSNYALNQYKDKIGVPILKTYTLNVIPELNKDWSEETDRNFAFFKKDDEYYILSLASMFGTSLINPKTKEKYDLRPGEVKKLENGTEILAFISLDFNNKIIFEKPSAYRTSNAKKYLHYSTVDPIAHNTRAVSALTSPKSQKADKVNKNFTFADIGGLDDTIEELKKFVLRPINYPKVYENVRLNKGILLYGPPRCGKTLLGKALANEAGIKYKYINASEFTHSTHGSSEKIARDVFKEIMAEPTILFIDEIDGIGKQRTGNANAQYDDKFLTQFLGCMSDLEKSNINSFVIAATNRKDLLDSALLDPGRFGLHLEILPPDKKGIGQIFDIHSKKQKFADDFDKEAIVDTMHSHKFNGSDIAETITNAYFGTIERLGLDKKMDAKTFIFEDLKSIKISQEDLLSAIKKLAKQKESTIKTLSHI